MQSDRDTGRQPAWLERALPTRSPDDLSGPGHRQAIGWLGASLPALVVLLDRARPTSGLTPDELTSISAYYYSSAVVAFSGVLAAMAVYLITYEGYDTPDGRRDRIASTIAGWAAAVVILFPTRPPGLPPPPEPTWWEEWIGWLQYSGAVVLFGSFVYFCIFRFTKSGTPRSQWDRLKWSRNSVYVFCGVAIAGALLLALRSGRRGEPIFWQEVAAVELFAVSWLLKGGAPGTILRLPGAVVGSVTGNDPPT